MSNSHAMDPEVLVNSWQNCFNNLKDVPISDFVVGSTQIKNIVYTLGSAFGIASSDITEKCAIMTERLKELEALIAAGGEVGTAAAAPGTKPSPINPAHAAAVNALGPAKPTLQYLVNYEMARKLERTGDSGPYVSGTRSLLRLMWFLDFLHSLISNLVKEGDDKRELSSYAQEAYDVALAKHHPWLLRKTIGGAMHFLPAKAKFFKNLAGEGGDVDAVVRPRLRTFLTLMNPVREELWKFYTDLKITDLP